MPYELKCVFASLPQMERGLAKVIGGDPNGNTFLYTNGKSVIIRDIRNPKIADIYTEHSKDAIVAKYAPSGNYIASGDLLGKIRIWDTTQKEHLLKYEYQPLSGKVMDIAWTEDSKRIAVVGDGREKYASVFLWDSGSSVGELMGHNKIINSVDIRQNRPYRIATGSDDNQASFFEGPPFKFSKTLKEHSKFVNSVRFSPNGNHLATAGADKTIHLYNGAKGDYICSFGDEAHKGGIYALSWSPDSSQLISASGDKTVKLWDAETGKDVTTFTLGSEVTDQQLGCLWQGEHLLSVSLSGTINYLDKNNPCRPIRTIQGHMKSIHCLTVHRGGDKPFIYSGSNEGHIARWDSDSGESCSLAGKGHTNQVSRITVNDHQELVSCSMDDTLRYTNTSAADYNAGDVVKMDFQPKCVSVAPGGLSLAVCISQLVLMRDHRKVFSLEKLGYDPEVGALHPGGTTAAVGDSAGCIHLYSICGNSLEPLPGVPELTTTGGITDLDFSPDGAYLAALDHNRAMTVYTVADNYAEKDKFYGHHAKPVTLSWSPDCGHVATGGMDMNVYIWDINDPDRRIKIPECHRLHHVTGLAWLDDHTLVTAAHDANIKQWTVTY